MALLQCTTLVSFTVRTIGDWTSWRMIMFNSCWQQQIRPHLGPRHRCPPDSPQTTEYPAHSSTVQSQTQSLNKFPPTPIPRFHKGLRLRLRPPPRLSQTSAPHYIVVLLRAKPSLVVPPFSLSFPLKLSASRFPLSIFHFLPTIHAPLAPREAPHQLRLPAHIQEPGATRCSTAHSTAQHRIAQYITLPDRGRETAPMGSK